MHDNETDEMYARYKGTWNPPMPNAVDYLDNDTQTYLDRDIIPACKAFGVSTNGARQYLAGQGITDPNCVRYISERII